MSVTGPAINITGFSTARLATWYFLEQFNTLFDAGDGLAANLGSKCEKIHHVFLSHADRDHLGGLIQLYQLSARQPNPPQFYYPKDSGSFPALREFLERFDSNLEKCVWKPVEAGIRITLGKNLIVEIGENDHITIANRGMSDQVKSLDFTLIETRKKLKTEFKKLSGQDIARIRAEKGEEYLTERIEQKIFGYSGDTPRFDPDRWHGTEVLVHEATFIAPDSGTRGHSELGEVIRAAAELDLKALILGHFSSRYKPGQIITAIRTEAERANLEFPVFAVIPGTVGHDILTGTPVWE